MIKKIIFAIVTVFVSVNAAFAGGEDFLKIPGVDYYGINHINVVQAGDVLYDTASSYDGFDRDISRFYTTDAAQVQLGGFFGVNGYDVSFFADTGYHTDKLDVTASGSVSISKDIYTTNYGTNGMDSFTINAGVDASVSAGIKHTSCTDSFDRQYYCGDLTAWSDFDQQDAIAPEFHIDGVNVNFTWKF